MAKDALGAHARDELGISAIHDCASSASGVGIGATFSVGCGGASRAGACLAVQRADPVVSVGSLLFLRLLGAIGAKAGGAAC
jgi:hypothetical protein